MDVVNQVFIVLFVLAGARFVCLFFRDSGGPCYVVSLFLAVSTNAIDRLERLSPKRPVIC